MAHAVPVAAIPLEQMQRRWIAADGPAEDVAEAELEAITSALDNGAAIFDPATGVPTLDNEHTSFTLSVVLLVSGRTVKITTIEPVTIESMVIWLGIIDSRAAMSFLKLSSKIARRDMPDMVSILAVR